MQSGLVHTCFPPPLMILPKEKNNSDVAKNKHLKVFVGL